MPTKAKFEVSKLITLKLQIMVSQGGLGVQT
jgi:hypothetical protein